ncbi:hypothetical protein J8273_5797 [Carpediemonas membranifera]|uniref:Uncharacterized protein n=1 Tax=Carpediemonas membranifera TaxID=201153 RepID=A0A8J6B4K8_9EUKA|nr:hypothetical protein J8273_5797 [Carpediemonas membranifera]|eukprot:KAG9392864.1 hypothetical protein J8273_5797 [Carpediemonas membranifera]
MVFIVGSYMSSSSMISCTPVVRNKMEIYTIKASIKQAFRQDYTEERRVGDYAAAKYLYSCLLARLTVECYAQRRQLPYMTPTSTKDCSLMYAAVIRVRPTRPSCSRSTLCRCGGRLPYLSINNSIRFVLDNANDIFEAGMRKSFRRVRFANHILRQKHFACCGQQLAREFGRHHPIATPIRLKVIYGSSGFTTPTGMFIPCAPYRKFAREIVPLLKRLDNIVVDLNMVNEDRTTVVCPHCHAPYKRVRPRDDQHVHPHRVMLCENPQCRGAQWRATVPDALNVDHRDKSAAENILWRSLATEDELSGSPFSRIDPTSSNIIPVSSIG